MPEDQYEPTSPPWPPADYPPSAPAVADDPEAKSRIAAGVLGIAFGWLGAHRFYLGHPAIGVAQIVVTIATLGLGWVWGIIEGILILTRDRRFRTDAAGRPLRD